MTALICKTMLLALCAILVLETTAGHPAANVSSDSKYYKRSIVHSHGLGGPVTVIADGVGRRRPSFETYKAMRDGFINNEHRRSTGSSIKLNSREIIANEILMRAKTAEYDKGLLNPHTFTPSRHFFQVLDEIRDSNLFKLLEKMPKGAVLHTHDTAIGSTDFLIELTYWNNLWMARDTVDDVIIFKFSTKAPASEPNFGKWTLVSEARNAAGKKAFDDDLRKRMSLYPRETFEDINDAWSTFMTIFVTIDGILTYAPAWKAYYYNALKELREDGVSYLEIRSTLPILYDLEGTKYTEIDTARLYKETLDQFLKDFPDFIGCKLIYAPVRHVGNEVLTEYIKIAIQLKSMFPTFFAGFDLVGQEDMGKPLIDFADQILGMPDNINFFFHAGETNWNGAPTDENLIDAVLLGTKRIGHGYALIKHPKVLDLVKQRDIAIEVNPISNQVLKLVADIRNHPCAYFFANDFPVVISSDDPSFWKAKPLSHDFYFAFLGIASRQDDLRLLKQLAMNSISYSALSSGEKEAAFSIWQSQWNLYIEWVIRKNTTKF